MKTIKVEWEETCRYSAFVNVPDDFDVRHYHSAAMERGICDLNSIDDYFDWTEDRQVVGVDDECAFMAGAEELNYYLEDGEDDD